MSALYFDSFNRANSTTTPGSADSGQAYGTVSGFTALGISSAMLYNPNATAGLAQFNLGVLDFDVSVTLGGTLGTATSADSAVFICRANAAFSSFMAFSIGTTSIIAYRTSSGPSAAFKTLTATVTSTSTVRFVGNGTQIQVYVGTTSAGFIDYAPTMTDTNMGWYFPASSTAKIDAAVYASVSANTAAESTLVTDIRELLDEPDSSDSYFTDAQILRLINQELAMIGAKVPIVTRQWTITGPGDANGEFALPEDLQTIEYLSSNNSLMPWITPGDRNAVWTVGGQYWRGALPLPGPFGAYIRGKRVGFSPALTSGSTVQVWYRPILSTLTNSTDIPEFPAYFEDCLRFGVMQRAMLKTQDFEGAAYYRDLADKAYRVARTAWGESQVKIQSIRVMN
jgi:hypothetical protein